MKMAELLPIKVYTQSSRQEGVLRIIQRLFYLFLNKNVCCDPSLEQSQRDSSNNGSQNMVYGEIRLLIPKLSL